MDPLAHLPPGSTDTSGSESDGVSAQEESEAVNRKDSDRKASGANSTKSRHPVAGRERSLVSERRPEIDFATLSKFGYSAGDESLAERYQTEQAEKAAAERKRAREEEERRQREEAKLSEAVERPVIPEGERRSAALKAELATRVKFMVDTGAVLDTGSIYGNCAATEAADAAAAREANRAKRSKHS